MKEVEEDDAGVLAPVKLFVDVAVVAVFDDAAADDERVVVVVVGGGGDFLLPALAAPTPVIEV